MATISGFLKGAGGTQRTRQDNNVAYTVDTTVDFATALVEKGSALAAADVIEGLVIPAGTVVLNAGLQVMVVDDATTLTLDLGYTGGDVDEFVDGFDHAAAAAGDYSAYLATDPQWIAPTNAETQIDLLVATLTGTLTVGKVRIWAVLAPVGPTNKDVGIAQVGS